MNYEQKTLPITKLVSNSGQIAGVPKNPRLIRDARFEALKRSITDTPEMLSIREVVVVPHKSKFVVICGNQRFKACKDLGGVIDRAIDLMHELEAYDDANGRLIEWYWDKYKEQENVKRES
jgi:hypothetical protein